MSHNCKSGYSGGSSRDANNNMYSGNGCSTKGYSGGGSGGNKSYQQQVTAKVLFGTVAAINELKLQERVAREARRTQ